MTNEELVTLIQRGINSRNNMQLLYEQNMGMIRRIARKYAYTAELEDLLQEAYFGLHKAVERFDPDQGATFLTYAIPWIRQAMKRYVEGAGGFIKVPAHMQGLIYRYNKIQSHFLGNYGREATQEEIADILYLQIKDVVRLETFMFQTSSPLSLDGPLLNNSEDSDMTIGDTIASSDNPEEQVIEKIVNEEVSGIWTEVSRVLKNPTMRDTILCRFRDKMTQVETAVKLGTNRETVRHLEQKSLRRLRSDSRTKRLLHLIV